MEKKEILKYVDHTLLTQSATWEEIRQILDDAMKYETASACIPASYVKRAADYVEGKLPICTVIGFPNGYSTLKSKRQEAFPLLMTRTNLSASELSVLEQADW